MPLEIVTISCRTDNYAYLARDPDTGEVALIDAPEAAPIRKELRRRGWPLHMILLTHHHDDHVAAAPELSRETGAQIIGAEADVHRLPPLDCALAEDEFLRIGAQKGQVMDVSGHTVGHLAFYFPDSDAVFTADSLMALGCGRVFEGTPEMMWRSLSKLKALPPETTVYSGHEYTAANAKFALTIEPQNSALISRAEAVAAARANGQPTVPSTLDEELRTNPFLRADLPDVKAHLGMPDATDAEVFAHIRKRKDRF